MGKKWDEQATLAKIQTHHGCDACKHKCVDEWLISQERFWCGKKAVTMDGTHVRSLAVDCIDWQLLTDKVWREKFIDEARQPSLPGGDE